MTDFQSSIRNLKIESKPEENEHVLVYCEYMRPKIQNAFWDGQNWMQNVFDFDNKIDYKCKIMNVSGWMYFPKPPIY
ncbi:DUF551 domain-containing protein [Chryseobacterium indologenes]|uniref:DUF551 domain-containing protein n=1 Tax=Chryseobacterium indologenes TaxID=253 RepID=UPI003C6DB15D